METSMDINVDLGGFLTQNTTYEYPDYEYKEDVKPKGSEAAAVFILVLYSVVLVVGLLGNALLLFVLAQKRHRWRISDTFLLNLCVADVLLLVTLPFRAVQAAQHSEWHFGAVFCKICGAVFHINFYCGILLLLCISLHHCLSIIRSMQLYSHKKPMKVYASCLLAWSVSLLLTIPNWIVSEAEKNSTQAKAVCRPTYLNSVTDWQLWPRLLHHIVGLLLPAVTLITCCYCILLRPHCSYINLRKQQVVTLLSLVAVFFICWMPYNIVLIVDTYWNSSKKTVSVPSLTTALMATSALGYVHACVRPVIYLIFCGNFRKRTLAILTCNASFDSTAELESSLWELGVCGEALPGQTHEVEELKQMTSEGNQVKST